MKAMLLLIILLVGMLGCSEQVTDEQSVTVESAEGFIQLVDQQFISDDDFVEIGEMV
jgi:hypothetical protein